MTTLGEEIKSITAEAEAYNLIQKYAFKNPSEIVVEDIAMDLGVLVIEDELDGAEARLIRKGKKGIIRVRKNIPEIGRKRFAIAHELGHWMLHSDRSEIDLYSEAGMKGYGSNPMEIEANIFASELLMPVNLYRPRCESIKPNLQKINQLAVEFQTTLTSAIVRYVKESLQSCAVVFSEDGKITWWRRSDSGKEFWFERKQNINRDSLAWYFFNKNKDFSEGERVPLKAWVKNQYDEESDMFEQSIRLGSYSTVLSLLWAD